MIWSEVQAGGGALTHTQPVNENYINTLLIPWAAQLESNLEGEMQRAAQARVILRYKRPNFQRRYKMRGKRLGPELKGN